jgi:hypothetical protein
MKLATVILFVGLSAGLAAISALAVWRPNPNWTEEGHRQLLRGTRPAAEKAASFFEKAIQENPASPYPWADLGEAYEAANRGGEAERAFQRAIELGPSSPPVLLRAGFYWLKAGDSRRALRLTARVLEISNQYDESIFALYRRFQISKTDVLAAGLGDGGRAWQSYLRWLIAQDKPAVAAEVWTVLGKKTARDEAITTAYLNYLILKRQYARVPSIWAEFEPRRARGYDRGAVIFEGGFEATVTKSPVDWRITPESEGVEAGREEGIAKEGEWSLAVRFPGKSNVTWSGVNQLVVTPPGKYRLRAWLKADHVTTDRGPQFEVRDADAPARMTVRSEPIRGTHDWKRIELPFQVGPETPAVMVGLVRRPSEKFDNKVAGTIWVDGVEITVDNPLSSHR